MKMLSFIIVLIMFPGIVAVAQTPCYFIFYGNIDGSTIDVHLDSEIRLNVWAATPAIGSGCEDLNGDGVVDSMIFMHTPLASNDSFIISRDGGEVFYPLNPSCDGFMDIIPNSPPGYTTQALFRVGGGPQCVPFNTNGVTLHVADFFMRTSDDVSRLRMEDYYGVFRTDLHRLFPLNRSRAFTSSIISPETPTAQVL
jgi:hypothetical protein